jgi:hypothetical protein
MNIVTYPQGIVIAIESAILNFVICKNILVGFADEEQHL